MVRQLNLFANDPDYQNINTDLDKYKAAWTEMMIEIWKEKITLLGIIDTGSLIDSLQSTVSGDTLTFRFHQYGIYVDSGVGYAYTDQAAVARLTDETYRIETGLDDPKQVGPAWGSQMTSGQARKGRHWFWKRFYSSTMKFKFALQGIIGDQFVGMVTAIEKRYPKR